MRNDCRFDADFEHKKYCSVAAAVVGSTVVGAVGSSLAADAQADAANSAAAAQRDASYAAAQAQKEGTIAAAQAQKESTAAQIAEARRQFDQIQKLLAPYSAAGNKALTGQLNLIGLGRGSPQSLQAAAIKQLADGPQMAELVRQGENGILQNASATGGLRGGNTQAALAQFRPSILNALIDQQYARLGGLSSMGQSAAAGVGNAGQNSSSQIINALGQQGSVLANNALSLGNANANNFLQQGSIAAGNALAQGRAQGGLINGISQAAGTLFGGGFGGSGGFGNLFGGGSSAATGLGGGSGFNAPGMAGSGMLGSQWMI